eukprot:TRINITY_DN47794_c0_g1_i1.p1 TRINITY_DN47794_c0_g1~~TRINITY_DN47794_c0_g1_i1.p1  ORF type:complete len:185 (+),score=63.36 TRINITY_DN47794_c0_g1_i1:47-601(+)
MSSKDDESSRSDSESEEIVKAVSSRPVKVSYCPECSYPAEYCEFSGKLEACKPWLETQLVEASDLKEKGKVKKKSAGEELPGGKKKKASSQEVVVSVSKRGGRKHITNVKGMEMFGHKLDDIAKQFKKQLSCGAAVVQNPGQPDSIDIQGDVADTLLERLPTKFKIPKDMVFKIVDKQKVPAYE